VFLSVFACGESEYEKPVHDTDSIDTSPGGSGGPVDGCIYSPVEGQYGYVHQCEGAVNLVAHAFVDHPEIGEVAKPFQAVFGFYESDDEYEMAKVMSCCEPLPNPTGGDHLVEDLVHEPHYKNCMWNMLKQMCRSIPVEIERIRDEVPVLLVSPRKQLRALANDIKENRQNECVQAFWSAVAAWDPSDPNNQTDDLWLEGSWQVPTESAWEDIEDIEFTMGNPGSTSRILGIWLPEQSSDWRTCEGPGDNDNVFLLEAGPDEGEVWDLLSGTASVEGPVIGRDVVTGSSDLASANTSCDLCSILAHDIDGNDMVIEALVLDSADATEVGTTQDSIILDHVRIALYSPLVPRRGSGNWVVGAGEAMFVITATSDGETGVVIGRNKGSFEVSEWQTAPIIWIEAFEIEYEDSSEETWTLTVGPLMFLD
jgi:hypothetical protein